MLGWDSGLDIEEWMRLKSTVLELGEWDFKVRSSTTMRTRSESIFEHTITVT